MPIPALLAAVLTGGAAFGGSTALTTFTIAKGFAWKKIGMSFILGASAAALAFAGRPRNPNAPDAPSATSNVSESISSARFVYGECRVGAVVAYAGEKDKDLWLVLALSEGACEEITGLFIGGQRQTIRNDNGVISVIEGDYAGHFIGYSELHATGDTSSAACAALRAASDGEWTANHRLAGISYVIVKLTQGEGEPYDGVPEINFIMKGRKFIHPGVANYDNLGKAGQTQPVAEWTDNAAAIMYDYCISRRGMSVADIDIPSFKEAIPYCDGLVSVRRPSSDYIDWPSTEKRYAANGVLFASDAVQGTMDELNWCMQGATFEFDGRMHCVPGRPVTPTIDIRDTDLIGEQIISYETTPPINNRVNVVNMSIAQSAQHDFQSYSLPEKVDQTQLTRDGERYEKDIGQRLFVTSPSAADRLQETALQRARHVGIVTFEMHPGQDMKWLSLKPKTAFRLTHDATGFENEWFEIVSVSLGEDMSLTVTAEETSFAKYADNPGLGEIPGRNLRVPRTSEAPERIAASDIKLAVVSRYSDDGAFFWRVSVSVPDSSLGFHARLEMGSNSPELQTSGSTIEFDIDHPPEEITVSVWRVSRTGRIGEERSVTATPRYSNIIPTPRRISWRATAGSLRIELSDPQVRAVEGADFRFKRVDLADAVAPGTISEANWGNEARFDSRTVLLQPGENALFHLNFSESGKYRIYARYIDSVGNAGPIQEMGEIALAAPVSTITTLRGSPDWPGTRNHMIPVVLGSDVPLLPDTADDPREVTGDEWQTPTATRTPDKWQGRVYKTGDTPGSWRDIDAGDTTSLFTGLQNGVEHKAEFRAVYNGIPTQSRTQTFTPQAAASAPPAPTLTGASGDTFVNLHSVIAGPQDARAPIQRHEYRFALSVSALATATWNSVGDSAALEKEFRVTGLSRNTAYFFQTRGVNGAGDGAASETLSLVVGGITEYGEWIRDTSPTIPVQLNVDDATDGVFRNGAQTFGQWTVTAQNGSQTQHQIYVQGESTRAHRSRTRTSQSAAWTDWSAFGNADAYTITDFDDTDSASPPRIVLAGTASNTFMRGTVPTYVYGSLWIVYNRIDPSTGSRDRQIAVKHYQDTGHTGSYEFYRSASETVAPTAPRKPTLTGDEDGYFAIDLVGTSTGDGGRAIDRWELKQATTESGVASAAWTIVSGARGNSFTLNVRNLSEGTSYFFRTRARNEIGYSTASDILEVSTQSYAAPSAPVLRAVASPSELTITLSASLSNNGGQAVTKWEYRQATSSAGLGSASWTTIAGAAGNTMTHTISSGFASNTQYFFQVRATNSRGASPISNAANARTIFVADRPTQPSLSVTVSEQTITLAASVSSNGGAAITRWEYQEATSAAGIPGSPWLHATGQTGNQMNFAIASRVRGSTYHYRVRCRNSSGLSPRSAIESVTVPGAEGAPEKPRIAQGTVRGNSVAIVGLTQSDNGAAVTSWESRRARSSAALGSATWGIVEGAAGVSFSRTFTGFLPPVEWLQIRCRNSRGYSPASDASSITVAAGIGVPTVGRWSFDFGNDLMTIESNLHLINYASNDHQNNGFRIDRWAYRISNSESGLASAPWVEKGMDDPTADISRLSDSFGSTGSRYVQIRLRNAAGWSLPSSTRSYPMYSGDVESMGTLTFRTVGNVVGSSTLVEIIPLNNIFQARDVSSQFYETRNSHSSATLGSASWTAAPTSRFRETNRYRGWISTGGSGTRWLQARAGNTVGSVTSAAVSVTVPAGSVPTGSPTIPVVTGIGSGTGGLAALAITNSSATATRARYATSSATLGSAAWTSINSRASSVGDPASEGDDDRRWMANSDGNLDGYQRYWVEIQQGFAQGWASGSVIATADTMGGSLVTSGSGTSSDPMIIGSGSWGSVHEEFDDNNRSPFRYTSGGETFNFGQVLRANVAGRMRYRLSAFGDLDDTGEVAVFGSDGAILAEAEIGRSSRFNHNFDDLDFTVAGSGTQSITIGMPRRSQNTDRQRWQALAIESRGPYTPPSIGVPTYSVVYQDAYDTNPDRFFFVISNVAATGTWNLVQLRYATSLSALASATWNNMDFERSTNQWDVDINAEGGQIALPVLWQIRVTDGTNFSPPSAVSTISNFYGAGGASASEGIMPTGGAHALGVSAGEGVSTSVTPRRRFVERHHRVGTGGRVGAVPPPHPGPSAAVMGAIASGEVLPQEGGSIDETVSGVAPQFTILTGNAQVRFNWAAPVAVATQDWPWGKIEGSGADFGSGSTYYDTRLEDLGQSVIGRVTGAYELYAPERGANTETDADIRMSIFHGVTKGSLTEVSLTRDTPSAAITARYVQGRIWIRKLKNRGIRDASWAFIEA